MSDHYVHRLQTSMPLKTAETIVDEALKAGADAGLLPLTVAVLDVGGNLVLLKRQDGSGNLRADVAIGKAWGALGMGISSRTIRDRLKRLKELETLWMPAGDISPKADLNANLETMFNEDDVAFRELRAQLERDWLPGLLASTEVSPDDLPLIWDADVLHGETSDANQMTTT